MWRYARYFSAYLCAALIVTFPLVLHFRTHCIGSQWDLWGALWNFWYLKTQVLAGQLHLTADGVFYPLGLNLWQDMGHFFVPLLSVPLQLVFSLPVTYNLLLILFLTLNAFCTWLLLEELLHSNLAAWVGGLWMIFAPYVWSHMATGSIEVVALWWIPLTLRYFLRLGLPGEQRADMLKAALCFILTALTGWLHGLKLGLLLLLLWARYIISQKLWQVRAPEFRARLAAATRMAGVFLLTLAVLLPFALALRRNYHGLFAPVWDERNLTPQAEQRYLEIRSGQVDLERLNARDVALVKQWSLIQASLSPSNFISRSEHLDAAFNTPGYGLIVFAVLGWWLGRPRSTFWGWSALGFLLLSFGPYLLFNHSPVMVGGSHMLPLPYLWLYKYLPWFNLLYRKERLILIVRLCLIILAGFFVAYLEKRYLAPGHKLRRAGLTAGLSLLVFASFNIFQPYKHLALMPVEVPEFYRTLEHAPQGALIELPYVVLPYANDPALYQFYQIGHGRKIFTASLIRPEMWLELSTLARRNTFVKFLVNTQQPDFPDRIYARDINAWQRLGFRFIVAHTRYAMHNAFMEPTAPYFINEGSLRLLARLFGAPRNYPDGIQVFDMDALQPDLTLDGSGVLQLPHYQADMAYFERQSNQLLQVADFAPGGPLQSFELYLPPDARPGPPRSYRYLTVYLYGENQLPAYAELKLYSLDGRLRAQGKYLLDIEPAWERVQLTLEPPCAPRELGRLEVGWPEGGRLEIREVQLY